MTKMTNNFTELVAVLLCAISVSRAQTPIDNFNTLYFRRVGEIVSAYNNSEHAQKLAEALTEFGNWSDVDYTSGCPANRALWKIVDHLENLLIMTATWYGNQENDFLYQKVSLALDHWFDNGYKEYDCINAGGSRNCPCGTAGFWNPNWWYQMIDLPQFIGRTCLLLKNRLTATQNSNCTETMHRAYVGIVGHPNESRSPLTGSNLLDVAYTGVSLALHTDNLDLMDEAIMKIHNECRIFPGYEDGIKVDGSFMQHSGQLYTGTYGVEFMKQMLTTFLETRETEWQPGIDVQNVFFHLIQGSEWIIYRKLNEKHDDNPLLSWQYSAIGRMVSKRYSVFKGIGIDLGRLREATESWESSKGFTEIVGRLEKDDQSVNPGSLKGAKYFWKSEYLVCRMMDRITVLKMFSTRTTNSECYNSQNPFGFHLSDGTIYTYVTGDEYTDVYGAWHWEHVPGTTVDLGSTTMNCDSVMSKGVESFVGAVTFGGTAVAAMNYTNPQTKGLTWGKNFMFFEDDSYFVHFSRLPSGSGHRIVTTLDQKQRHGPVYIDGAEMEPGTEIINKLASSVYHDKTLYEFPYPVTLTVDIGEKQSDWSAIGASEGNETQYLINIFFEMDKEIVPGFGYWARFNAKPGEIGNKNASGEMRGNSMSELIFGMVKWNYNDIKSKLLEEEIVISASFWEAGTLQLDLPSPVTKITTDVPILLVLKSTDGDQWQLAYSDPSWQNTDAKLLVQFSNATSTAAALQFSTGENQGATLYHTLL